MTDTLLLIIDPQNDFCDLPAHTISAAHTAPRSISPALPVAGADADMQRLATWIARHGAQIDAITVTLDSHQRFDIAHPDFWQQGDGSPMAPFTPITAVDLKSARVRTANIAHHERALAYLQALEARGRFTHMVWPVHCELGTWGHGIHHAVWQAINAWQQKTLRAVNHIIKGTNPWCEHYSALQAEIPDAADTSTGLHRGLLAQVSSAKRVVVAGEASSHCVARTVEDLLAHLPIGSAERFLLLRDCTSPVTGFEEQHQAFLERLSQQGASLRTSVQ